MTGTWDHPDNPPRPWAGVSDQTIHPKVDCNDGWGPTQLEFPAGDTAYVTEAQKIALEGRGIRWTDTREGATP